MSPSAATPASVPARAGRPGRLLRSPRAGLVGALLVALVLFQAVYGLRLLNAGDAYWTNPHGDMGQMLAGELAGLRAPWGFPLLVVRTLTAPDPVSLVYTDSIPWLTALLKLLHLGPVLSLLGTFLLLSWLAQAAAMYGLLRACGVRRRWTLFVGSTLALLVPAFLGRQVGHVALSGHALQIAGLALAVRAARHGLGARGAAAFTALGVLAAGVHAYHVPPIAVMLLAALASDALQRRPGAGLRAAVVPPVFLLALVLAAWTLGYFVGRGDSGGMAALGYYEMNLIAPVFPQGSALAGHRWNGGWFTHTFDPTGGQSFEGYNYLGAGVLLLVAVAAAAAWRGRLHPPAPPIASPAAPEPTRLRRWGPLVAGLALLTLYAVGPNGWLGSWRVWSLPLPTAAWMEPLALFRGHGRFFWTVGYALLAAGVVAADRLPGPRLRTGLLAGALLLQLADATALLGGLHQRFSAPEALRIPPAFAGPAFEGRDYRVYPGYFCTASWLNQMIIRQLSLAAQRRHASTTSAETAREPVASCTRPVPLDAREDAGVHDRRITVVMGADGGSSPLTSLFSRRRDCFSYGVVWICGRDLASVPSLLPVDGGQLVAPEHLDAKIALGAPPSNPALLSGWSKPEGSGVWSEATRATLRLPHPDLSGGGVTVTLEALSFQPEGREPQRAYLSVRGERLVTWRVESGGYHGFQVAVPARLLDRGKPFDLVIDLPDAVSPESVLPGSGDPRLLGIGVKSASIAH